MHPILAFKPSLAYLKYAALLFHANLGHLDNPKANVFI